MILHDHRTKLDTSFLSYISLSLLALLFILQCEVGCEYADWRGCRIRGMLGINVFLYLYKLFFHVRCFSSSSAYPLFGVGLYSCVSRLFPFLFILSPLFFFSLLRYSFLWDGCFLRRKNLENFVKDWSVRWRYPHVCILLQPLLY